MLMKNISKLKSQDQDQESSQVLSSPSMVKSYNVSFITKGLTEPLKKQPSRVKTT